MIPNQYPDRIYTNNTTHSILQVGWNSHFQTQLKNICSNELIQARVVRVRKNSFRISNVVSGLNLVIILTKADLHQDPGSLVKEVEMFAFGVSIHLISALDRSGLTPLEAYLSHRQHQSADRVETERWKAVALKMKAAKKRRRNG